MNQYNNQQDQFVHPSVVKQFAHLPDGRPNPLLAQFATGLVKNLGSIKFDPRAGLTEEDRYLIQERQKLAQQAVEINRQLTEQQIQAEKDAAMAQFKQMAGAGRQKTQQPPPQPQQWQQPVPQQQPVQQPIPQPEYYQNQEWVPNEYVNNSSNIISLDEDAKFFFTYHFTEINNNLLKLIDLMSSNSQWPNYGEFDDKVFETGEEPVTPDELDPLDETETDGKQD